MSSIFCTLALQLAFCDPASVGAENAAFERAHAAVITKRSAPKFMRKPIVKERVPDPADTETVVASTSYRCTATCWTDQGLGVTPPCKVEGVAYPGMTGMELALEDRQLIAALNEAKAEVKVLHEGEYNELDAQAYIPEVAKPPIWQPMLVFGTLLAAGLCVVRYSYHQSGAMGEYREN